MMLLYLAKPQQHAFVAYAMIRSIFRWSSSKLVNGSNAPSSPGRSLLPHYSLKLDVGGGFLRCFWNLNKIESKTVRAFARGVLLGEPRFA